MIDTWWQFFLATMVAGVGIRIGWSVIGLTFAYLMHWAGACDCPEHQ